MKILIGIPCMGSIHAETVGSLLQLVMSCRDIEFKPVIYANSLVYHARNEILNLALKDNVDYLLFLDSDIIFPVEAVKKLISLNKGVVTGIYYARNENSPGKAIIYRKITPRSIFHREALAEQFKGHIEGLQQVSACGMGFCLIRSDVIRRICKRFISPFEPFRGLGEDLAFCYRLNRIKEPIYALNVGLEHIGTKHYKEVAL